MNVRPFRVIPGLFAAVFALLLVPHRGLAVGWQVAGVERTQGAVTVGRTVDLSVRFRPADEAVPVAVDLEIFDLGGRSVAQRFAYASGDSLGTYAITSPALPPGTYYLSAGIFSKDWGRLLAWFDHLAVFTVYERSPCGDDCRVAVRNGRLKDGSLVIDLENGNVSNVVLVDLELRDSEGRKIAQRFWDAQRFDARSVRTYSLELPGGLTPGEYSLSAGVFFPHWADLAGWYPALANFKIE